MGIFLIMAKVEIITFYSQTSFLRRQYLIISVFGRISIFIFLWNHIQMATLNGQIAILFVYLKFQLKSLVVKQDQRM